MGRRGAGGRKRNAWRIQGGGVGRGGHRGEEVDSEGWSDCESTHARGGRTAV